MSDLTPNPNIRFEAHIEWCDYCSHHVAMCSEGMRLFEEAQKYNRQQRQQRADNLIARCNPPITLDEIQREYHWTFAMYDPDRWYQLNRRDDQ